MQRAHLLLCGLGLALPAGWPMAQEPVAIGAEAPPLELPMLRGGQLDLAADRGHRVVVVLFVSHATRSKDPWTDLTPDLHPVAHRYPGALRVVTVVTGSGPVAQGLLAALPSREHPQVAHDQRLGCVPRWVPKELRGTTAAVVVDRAGRIAWVDEESPLLFEILAAVIAGQHDLEALAELAAAHRRLQQQVRGHPGTGAAVERVLELDPGDPRAWSLRLRRASPAARIACIRAALGAIRTRPRIAWFLLQSGTIAGAGESRLPTGLVDEIADAVVRMEPQPWLPVAQARLQLALAAARGDPARTEAAAQQLLRCSVPDPTRLLLLAQSLEEWCRWRPVLTAAVADTGLRAAAVAAQSAATGLLAHVLWLRLASRSGATDAELSAIADHIAASITDPDQLHTCANQLLAPDFSRSNARAALRFLRRLEQTDERFRRAPDWLATAALAHFHAGDAALAVRLQTQAIEAAGGATPAATARLLQFEAAADKR